MPIETVWYIYESIDGKRHVVPDNDIHDHYFWDCPCKPDTNYEEPIVVHHAWDGREAFESGERLPS